MDRADSMVVPLVADDPGTRASGNLTADACETRLEAWAAERLEPRTAASMSADAWLSRIGKPVRASNDPGRPGSGSRIDPGQDWKRIRVAHRDGITLVRFVDRQLMREDLLGELRHELRGLVQAGGHRLVISFQHVERVSSAFLETLTRLARDCEQRRGQLRLCRLNSHIGEALNITGLTRLVSRYEDESTALQTPWPFEPAALPVEILEESATPRRPANESFGPVDDGGDAGFAPPETERGPLCLQIERNGRHEGWVPIPEHGLAIGRERPCRLRIGARTVSRRHAWIGFADEAPVLEDLGSTNGTKHNDRLLRSERVAIRAGDAIEIGPCRLRVREAAEPIAEAIVAEWMDGESGPSPDTSDRPETEAEVPMIEPREPTASGRSTVSIERIEDALVVTPKRLPLDDEEAVDELRDLLVKQLEAPHPVPRVVLNLSFVPAISGRAIGMFLAHHLRLRRLGGALRLAAANAAVAMALESSQLPKLLDCHSTLEEAVLASWPETEEKSAV